jgi:hypothetical protein
MGNVSISYYGPFPDDIFLGFAAAAVVTICLAEDVKKIVKVYSVGRVKILSCCFWLIRLGR